MSENRRYMADIDTQPSEQKYKLYKDKFITVDCLNNIWRDVTNSVKINNSVAFNRTCILFSLLFLSHLALVRCEYYNSQETLQYTQLYKYLNLVRVSFTPQTFNLLMLHNSLYHALMYRNTKTYYIYIPS